MDVYHQVKRYKLQAPLKKKKMSIHIQNEFGYPLAGTEHVRHTTTKISQTSEEELSGIVKKSPPNPLLLTLCLLLFCAILSMIYDLLYSKRAVNLSFNSASMPKFHEEGNIFSSTEETVSGL